MLACVPTATLALPELREVDDPDPIITEPDAVSLLDDPIPPLPEDGPIPLVSEILPPVDAEAIEPVNVIESVVSLGEARIEIMLPVVSALPVTTDMLPALPALLD